MRDNVLVTLAGDLAGVAVVVTLGFLSHGETPFTGRWPVTFAVFGLAWVWVAFPSGLLDVPSGESWARSIGRLAWGWTLATPLGALLRGWLLGRGVPVTFVLVMGLMLFAVTAVWRSFLWARARRVQAPEPRP